jgi:uncharacterized damage-inducible protein DinB
MSANPAAVSQAEPHVEPPHLESPYVEPWMRGTHTEVPTAGRAVIHALELSRDDIRRWTRTLTDTEVNSKPLGLPSIAFHLRHIARSVDRILTYAEGNQLSSEQLAALKSEQTPAEEPMPALLAELEGSLQNAFVRISALTAEELNTARGIGRRQLPTTLGGAMIHVADHTQRHAGQIITTAKVLLALRPAAT